MSRDVQIKIGATDNASRVLGRVGQSVTSLGGMVKRAAASMLQIGAAVSAASVTVGVGLKKIVDEFAEAGDIIHKTALRTKLSAEFLSEIGFAAEQSGSSLSSVSDAMFRVFRQIGDAQTGTGPAADALEELGLSVTQISKLKPEEIFFQLVDAINGVEDPLRRSQLGFELFGRKYQDLVPLLESGSTEIRAMMREAESLGRSMSGEQAEAAAAYTDEMNRLRSVLIGLRNEIGAQLAPAFTKVGEAIRFAFQNAGAIIDAVRIKILDLNIALLETMNAVADFVPFASSNNAPAAIGILQQQRAQIIADRMSQMLGDALADGVSGIFTGNPSGSFGPGGANDIAGIARRFRDDPFAGDPVRGMIAPPLQATQSRLMQRGPAVDAAAKQGQLVLKAFKAIEDLLAGGGPQGGIPVIEQRNNPNEFEMVRAV